MAHHATRRGMRHTWMSLLRSDPPIHSEVPDAPRGSAGPCDVRSLLCEVVPSLRWPSPISSAGGAAKTKAPSLLALSRWPHLCAVVHTPTAAALCEGKRGFRHATHCKPPPAASAIDPTGNCASNAAFATEPSASAGHLPSQFLGVDRRGSIYEPLLRAPGTADATNAALLHSINELLRTVATATGEADASPSAHPPGEGDEMAPPPMESTAGVKMQRERLATLLSTAINNDVLIGQHIVQNLSEDVRRKFLVLATASEYFGEHNAERELNTVSTDRDSRISSAEYEAWINAAVNRTDRGRGVPIPGNSSLSTAQHIPTENNHPAAAPAFLGNPTSPHHVAPRRPASAAAPILSRRLWISIALYAGAPFVAFGFLDNAVLCLSGGLIDSHLSHLFGISSLTAAGLGGIVSGTLGIQVHGLTEQLVRSRLAPPVVSIEQEESTAYSAACHWGNVAGMVTGLLLGMLPLLWMPVGSPDLPYDAHHDRPALVAPLH